MALPWSHRCTWVPRWYNATAESGRCHFNPTTPHSARPTQRMWRRALISSMELYATLPTLHAELMCRDAHKRSVPKVQAQHCCAQWKQCPAAAPQRSAHTQEGRPACASTRDWVGSAPSSPNMCGTHQALADRRQQHTTRRSGSRANLPTGGTWLHTAAIVPLKLALFARHLYYLCCHFLLMHFAFL